MASFRTIVLLVLGMPDKRAAEGPGLGLESGSHLLATKADFLLVPGTSALGPVIKT